MTDTDPNTPIPSTSEEFYESQTATVFGLLSSETRLEILLALWAAYEPASQSALSFSTLFDHIDYTDAGNFSYHLDKLDGQFVRKGPDGYELRKPGLELVKTVIAGAGLQDTTLEPTLSDRPCEVCGAETTVQYDGGVLTQTCTDCSGVASDDALPEGYLNSFPLHPTGIPERTADELLVAAEVAAYHHLWSMFQGLCPTCSASVDATLEVCSEHDSVGDCSSCGRAYPFWANFHCETCKDHHVTTPAVVSELHPSVVAFYHDHGVAPRWHGRDTDGLESVAVDSVDTSTTLQSRSPLEVAVVIGLEGDEIRLTFDEAVRVTDVQT